MDEEKLLKDLASKLEDGTCILILGPEAHLLEQYPDDNLPSHWDVMVEKANGLQGKSFNSTEGFFFQSGSTLDEWYDEKKVLHESISGYYASIQPPAFYDYLASMRFSTIISLSPDDLMPRVMERLGYPFDFVYYKKTDGRASDRLQVQYEKKNGRRKFKSANSLPQPPEEERPLILNLLGYHEDRSSMLYTYESLFEFMYDVFPVTNIPGDVRNAIVAADSYLFIGFGYRYWYLKILFFLLDKILKGQEKMVSSQAIFNFGEQQNPVLRVYEQVFKMNFYKKPIAQFAELLFTRCATNNLLRTRSEELQKEVILFISSLPDGKMPIRPDKDWADIKKHMAIPEAIGRVEIKEELCTQVDEILYALNVHKPTLLIVSAHGSEKGLFFEKGQEEEVELSGVQLLEKLKAHRLSPGSQLKLVMLGACHSKGIADTLVQETNFAIGMIGPIHDESVRLFTAGFLENYFIAYDVPSSVEAGKQKISDDQRLNVDKDLVALASKQLPTAPSGISPVSSTMRSPDNLQSNQTASHG